MITRAWAARLAGTGTACSGSGTGTGTATGSATGGLIRSCRRAAETGSVEGSGLTLHSSNEASRQGVDRPVDGGDTGVGAMRSPAPSGEDRAGLAFFYVV
ncbi:hypothetical protein G6021_04890 [Dietzia sp. CW19]|nr:hypothetical protein [Dietzia sp. CW19]